MGCVCAERELEWMSLAGLWGLQLQLVPSLVSLGEGKRGSDAREEGSLHSGSRRKKEEETKCSVSI